MKSGAASEVIESFKQRGFDFIGKADDGWFRLQGNLNPFQQGTGYLCEIQLDPTFFELPRVRLLQIPRDLPPVVPHLASDGALCYIARGTVVLDIFDPIGQSLACLDRATYVLGSIVNGGMVEDLAEEFHAYWGEMICFVDLEGEDLGKQRSIVGEASKNPFCFVTDNEERTQKKLCSMGLSITDKYLMTYRVKTKAQPRALPINWPPHNVRDLLIWQGALDDQCRKKILQRIRDVEKNKANGLLVVVESPLLTYGFAVYFNRENRRPKAKMRFRKDPVFGLKVIPVSVVRIDDRYIAQRNIPKLRTLAGKNIAIVGCGTIGGYLAEMLVKGGAGTLDGKLTLVDFEFLQPQNIGRHRLGFPHLLSNKAAAMADELRRLMPGANICALPVDARLANLANLDLLIDATGEEALGHWLCSNYSLPMLSIWIEGPGTAVRGLLKANRHVACYRCLWHSNKRGELRSVVERLAEVWAGHGCEGLYVPFPASVSVSAASLGAEMALDWANSANSPALRTRLIDQEYHLATPDCDPLQDRDCPICNL